MPLSTFDYMKNSRPEGGFCLDDGQLKKLQETLAAMLRDLNSLAEQNGIPIYLSGGTLLGAIRHGGFIPWDDDVDINLERKDYDRFLSLLRTERADVYWIHTPETTHNYGILSSRIRLKGTDVRQREDDYSDEFGVCIDIFPIENVYDSGILYTLQGFLCMTGGFLLSCRKFYARRKELKPLFQTDAKAKQVFLLKKAAGFLVSWGSVDFWTKTANRAYSLCHDRSSTRVAIPAGRRHFFRETYLREEFCSDNKVCFEGDLYRCTSNPDAYMKALFGASYMQLPPEDRRERHVFYSFRIPEPTLLKERE